MEKRFLVTGANGFVGSYLIKQLVEGKAGQVFGTVRTSDLIQGRLEEVKGKIKLIECDITNKEKVGEAVREARPDVIFHLAAQASVKSSFEFPEQTFEVNLFGTKNLLEAASGLESKPTIVLVGSSEQYGLVKEEELPIKETQEFRPMSPYAVSKAAADLLGYQYYTNHQLPVVRIRPFNHTGPGREEKFVLSSWCKQVAEMEKGLREAKLRVGNIETIRDFLDVRDVVKAYCLAAEKCQAGEAYNICRGQGSALREVIEKLKGLTEKEFEVVADPKLKRRVDIPRLIGDNSKFCQATGWQPEISLEKLLGDMLDYWRAKV